MTSRARMVTTMFALWVLPVLVLCAQTVEPDAPAQASSGVAISSGPNHRTPKVEFFVGYSYFRSVPTLAAGNRMVALHGGDASIALNFNSHLALVGDFGGYDDSQLLLTGTSANEPRTVNSSGTAYTYLFGPRVRFGKRARISPFAQVLVGGMHASAVTVSNCSGAICAVLPAQNTFALTAGAGLDIRLTHLISIRAIQAEYMMTRFADATTGASAEQNDMRLSTGLVFRFGGRGPVSLPPPPPPAATAPAPELGKVYAPPTVGCLANPSSLSPGDTSTITATGTSPDNLQLTYSYGATVGAITGAGSTATLSTAGVVAGTIIVTCNVVDANGQSASQTTQVAVVAIPAVQVPMPMSSTLCTVSFDRDTRRPARVDNEAKACLDDVALTLQRSSDSRLAIVGSVTNGERGGNILAAERATNAKEYLVKEKGIDSSRVSAYSGPGDGKRVSITLIPAGAPLDLTGDTAVNEEKNRGPSPE